MLGVDQENLAQYNLFAYCLNNPVNMIDSDGKFAIPLVIVAGVILFAGCTALLAYVNTPSFQRSWSSMCNGIAKAFSGAISWASTQAKSIAKSIGDSFAQSRSIPKYRSPREVHHIVAQMAPNASRARDVLQRVGLSVNSPLNLVSLKTGLHRRLHTNTYYGFANSVVISAYDKGRNDYERRRNVVAALGSLRAMLLSMDAVAPY